MKINLNFNPIHKIAVDYFEGRIAPNDEHLLCDFLKTPENRAQFHAWEAEWLAHSTPSAQTERAWNRFKLQQNVRTIAEVRPARTHKRWLWYAAAAVATLLLITAVGAWRFVAYDVETPCYAVEAARGEKSKVLLADGSVVYLNAKSKLTYDSGFNEENRHVHLVGEGYFEVAKNAELPFVVEVSDNYTVTVTGTKFNVSAYAEDNHITTSLFEGAVTVACGDSVVRLRPNEALHLTCSTGTLQRYTSGDNSSMEWIHNRLIYNGIAASELFNRLSRQYNVTLMVDAPALEHDTLRIALRNHENFEDVLFALEQVLPIETRLQNDTVFISSSK